MEFSFDLNKKETVRIAVIGVGQVGLRVCHLFASAGYRIYALDIDGEKIRKLERGISPLDEDGLGAAIPEFLKSGRIIPSADIEGKIGQSNIIMVCVPTLASNNRPDLGPILSTAETISRGLKKGSLVVIESTVYPGVIEEFIKPVLEKSGLKMGEDFGIVNCPERIDPGNSKFTIFNIPRVIGASDKESLEVGKRLYESALDAEVMAVSNMKTAEMSKIFENTFRDVNIAYVNEIAKAVDGTEIDIMEVIKAASTKPFAFIPHYPGSGVGGGCIPVNPIWLMEFATKNERKLDLVRLAREINSSMAEFVAEKLTKKMLELKKVPKETSVLVLGLTYKEDVKDLTNTPAKPVILELKKRGFAIQAYDPLLKKEEVEAYFGVKEASPNSLEDLEDFDAIVIVTYHKQFQDIFDKIKKLNKRIILFDTKNRLKNTDVEKNVDVVYMGVGV